MIEYGKCDLQGLQSKCRIIGSLSTSYQMRQLGWPNRRMQENIRKDVIRIRIAVMNWTVLTQARNDWRLSLTPVLNISICML